MTLTIMSLGGFLESSEKWNIFHEHLALIKELPRKRPKVLPHAHLSHELWSVFLTLGSCLQFLVRPTSVLFYHCESEKVLWDKWYYRLCHTQQPPHIAFSVGFFRKWNSNALTSQWELNFSYNISLTKNFLSKKSAMGEHWASVT